MEKLLCSDFFLYKNQEKKNKLNLKCFRHLFFFFLPIIHFPFLFSSFWGFVVVLWKTWIGIFEEWILRDIKL